MLTYRLLTVGQRALEARHRFGARRQLVDRTLQTELEAVLGGREAVEFRLILGRVGLGQQPHLVQVGPAASVDTERNRVAVRQGYCSVAWFRRSKGHRLGTTNSWLVFAKACQREKVFVSQLIIGLT